MQNLSGQPAEIFFSFGIIFLRVLCALCGEMGFLPAHLLLEDSDGGDKTDDGGPNQHEQVTQLDLPAEEGNAGAVEKSGGGKGLDVRQNRIGI